MKRIENAYATVQETLGAIERLIETEARSLSEIVVVTNTDNKAKLVDVSPVEVVAIPAGTQDSIWNSIQSLFANKKSRVLTDYGVDETSARAHVEAIRYGKYVVLVEELQEYEDTKDSVYRTETNKSRLQDAKRPR